MEAEGLLCPDDPYFYLYFGSAERSPSYFALEPIHTGTAGRVIRFDSMSKVLSAGLRLGFATGPAPIIDAIDLHVRSSRFRPSLRAHLLRRQRQQTSSRPG
jgi:tryptophan aminotransferase